MDVVIRFVRLSINCLKWVLIPNSAHKIKNCYYSAHAQNTVNAVKRDKNAGLYFQRM